MMDLDAIGKRHGVFVAGLNSVLLSIPERDAIVARVRALEKRLDKVVRVLSEVQEHVENPLVKAHILDVLPKH